MKTGTFAYLMLAAAVGQWAAGCSQERPYYYSSDDSRVTGGQAVAAPAAAQQPAVPLPAPAQSPGARASADPLPARPAPIPGQNASQLPVPSGQAANSPLLVESFAPQEVIAGMPFEYRIRLTNLTDADVEGVVLTAAPLDFKPTAIGPKGTVDAEKAVWDVGTLKARATKIFLLRGKAAKVGMLTACAEVVFRNPRLCMPIRVVQPALRLVQTGQADALICEAVTWRVVVSNSGTGTARNVVVREDLPEGMTAADGTRSVLLNAGDLASDQSKEMIVQARVSRPGQYTGKATAVAADGLTAVSDEVTTKVRQPLLAVTKEGPQVRYVGRPVSYTITVRNTGDGEARETVLTDTVPEGLKLTGVTQGGQQSSDGKITWNLGTLAPGAQVKVVVSGVGGGMGTLTSSAVAKARCAEGSATAITAIRGIPAILLEMVDDPDPVEIGTTTTYTTTVTNQGSAPDGNIVVKCIIPPEEAYVSSSGATAETVEGQTVTFAPLPSLAPKAQAVYKVVVKGVKAGDVRFKVLLTSDMMSSPAMKTESTHIYGD